MSELLFIYGTLHPDRASGEIASIARRLESMGRGTVQGRLLDLGEYPGLVLDGEVTAIAGELFAVPDDATLAEFDAYEDYRQDDLPGSLFLRRKAVVALEDGCEISCWVYVYNR